MQRSYKKIHTGLFYSSIILLLAYCISFSAFFYTGNCVQNYNPVPGSEVKTYTEIVINKVDSDALNPFHRTEAQMQKIHAFSFFSHLTDLFGTDLTGTDIYGVLLLVSALLLLWSVSIPDAFSLFDLKVRLND